MHGHLDSLWREARTGTGEVLLAVPGCYDREPARDAARSRAGAGDAGPGVVDAALAAATAGFVGERLLHVELGLHRAVVTQIRQGDALVRERVATIDRWGADEVVDAQMRGAAQAFVKQARFDPLHDAATEQALFDRLPGWLAALEREPGLAVTLPAVGREVETVLTREQAEAWTARHADELQQQVSVLQHSGEPTGLLVSAHAARLPGLVARLADVRGLDRGAAAGPRRRGGRAPARARPSARSRGRCASSRGCSGPRRRRARARRRPLRGRHRGPRRPLPEEVAGPPTCCWRPPRTRSAPSRSWWARRRPPERAGARLAGETAGVSRAHCPFFESAGESVVEDLSSWGTFLNGERVAGRAVLAPATASASAAQASSCC